MCCLAQNRWDTIKAEFDFSEDVLRKGSEVLFAAGMKYIETVEE